MSDVKYVWFDWEDNTTSVNTINIIKEPRKPLDEYKTGEEIKAKLPNFGTRLWNGVIVEIGDSKKELIAQMDRRQKLQALEFTDGSKKQSNCQKASSDSTYTTEDGEDRRDVAEQQIQAQPEQNEGETKKGKKMTKDKLKRPSDFDSEKQAEKKRKLELEQKKVEAANIQFKEIIEKRRQTAPITGQSLQEETSKDSESNHSDVVVMPTVCEADRIAETNEPCHAVFQRSYSDTQTDSMAFYQQPQWGFSPYRPSPYKWPQDTIYQMRTHGEEVEELKSRITQLQEENIALKLEVNQLRAEKEKRNFSFTDKVAVSPSKIEFLRHLASCLEENKESDATTSIEIPGVKSPPIQCTVTNADLLAKTPVRPQPIRPQPIRPQPIRPLPFSETSGASDEHDICLPEPEQNCSDHLKQNIPRWEEPETENGKQKIRLVPDRDVFLLPAQLSEAVLKGAEKPSLLIIALLEVFFSYEVLATSKAKGARSAHNKKSEEDTQPLPAEVISAIKSFVLKQFKKPNGTPCLTDKEMTDVINNKCGTARRSLQKSQLIALGKKYRHENIVTLYGYALDGDEVCLVYQYMPNGSLDDCLHQRNGHNVLLDWYQRLNILKNAACGLQFLHSVDRKPVIHGDIKSANILLDRHFDAKIGDLGLAQQATGGTVTGELTHITKKNTDCRDYKNKAYYAPEILRGNGFSIKGDTYAFGVVIFECLTGQEAYDEKREGSTEKNLVEHIESQLDTDQNMNRDVFQDSQVKAPCQGSMFLSLFELAEKCTARLKKNRPTMEDVFHELERIEKDTSLQETDQEKKADSCEAKVEVLKRENSEGYSSYCSSGGYSPGVKVQGPPSHLAITSSQGQGHMMPATSPIDLLPKDHPVPEAIRLQLIHDQRKQDDHVYQNVPKLSGLSLYDGSGDLASDPKKQAQLNREESEEYNYNGIADFPKSDPKKVKALEDFDKGVASEHLETESFPASDPKKLAMIMGQDSIVSGANSAAEVQYENVPSKRRTSNEDFGQEGVEQEDTEGEGYGGEGHMGGVDKEDKVTGENIDETIEYLRTESEMLQQAVIADQSQPIKQEMIGLFDKYQQNVGELYDLDLEGDIDFTTEGDDDSESTLTEGTCMADFGESENSINDEELFASDGGHDHHDYENLTPKKETTTTTTETISSHHKRLELYQNMSKACEQASEATEQTDKSQLHTVADKHLQFQSPVPKSRAPTEDECYE